MRYLLPFILLCACPYPSNGGGGSPLSVRGSDTTVYVAFGSDSQVTADDWSFCTGTGLECSFALDGERKTAKRKLR